MLDRQQHLKLFLTGSGDSQEDADRVVSDERVQEELNQQPVNTGRLINAIRQVSKFRFPEDQFLVLFSRYKSPDYYPHTNPSYDPPVKQIRDNRARAKRASNG